MSFSDDFRRQYLSGLSPDDEDATVVGYSGDSASMGDNSSLRFGETDKSYGQDTSSETPELSTFKKYIWVPYVGLGLLFIGFFLCSFLNYRLRKRKKSMCGCAFWESVPNPFKRFTVNGDSDAPRQRYQQQTQQKKRYFGLNIFQMKAGQRMSGGQHQSVRNDHRQGASSAFV